jgi:beta-galactosidase
MAHILPHWNWPERIGQVTPVHVFTSGDEAELFLNGQSLGRKKKGPYEYRLRWDSVVYQPGELKVVAYKNNQKWAEDVVKTTGDAAKLLALADRQVVKADGKDLIFITIQVSDKDGLMVPRADNDIAFSIEGAGEIVATDNGDATNMVALTSNLRQAFNGLCLVIVRAKAGQKGAIQLTAKSLGLESVVVNIESK